MENVAGFKAVYIEDRLNYFICRNCVFKIEQIVLSFHLELSPPHFVVFGFWLVMVFTLSYSI